MQLLADHLVSIDMVDSISDETVRQTLKKTTRFAVAQTAVVHSIRECRICSKNGKFVGFIQ